MPNTNCCVPLCHATSKRHKQLSWHALPRDPKLKKRWAVVIRNDTLKVNSRGTSVCGLHFQGGRRSYLVDTPTIFPWTPDWQSVVNEYNAMVTEVYETNRLCNADIPVQKPTLLTVNLPPTSACSPAAVRRGRQRRRTAAPHTTTSTSELSTGDTSLSDLPRSKVSSYVHVLLFYKYVHSFYVC